MSTMIYDDAAWFEATEIPAIAGHDTNPESPEIHALTTAAEQLHEARYWSTVQPGVCGAYLTALATVAQELAWHLDQVQALLPAGVQAYRAATGTAATGLAGAQPPTATLLLTAAMQEVINEGQE